MRKPLLSTVIAISLSFALPIAAFALVTNTPVPTTPATMLTNNARPDLTSILQSLSSKGYPIIKSVALNNGVYQIKAENYLGKSVTFNSDANGNLSSKVQGPAPMPLVNAVQNLEAQGYQVQDIKVDGKVYKAKVLNASGSASTVKVNVKTGQVSS